MSSRRRVEFGSAVLASAETDAQLTQQVGSRLTRYLLLALFSSGFGGCGLWQLFGAH